MRLPLEVFSDGVLEDMSLASRFLKETFSSPWPWPCAYRSMKFSVTDIDRCTDAAAKFSYDSCEDRYSRVDCVGCIITTSTVGTIIMMM